MIEQGQIRAYLEELATQHPSLVMAKLQVGSRVLNTLTSSYLIDDPDVDRRVWKLPDGIIPYGQINRALRNAPDEIFRLFNGRSIVPFSLAFEAGIGECLEKSILVQLAAQRGRVAFLIRGGFSSEKSKKVQLHAFNVVFKDEQPYLIDAQNPLKHGVKGDVSGKYLAPIIGIESNLFVVSSDWKHGRTYSFVS